MAARGALLYSGKNDAPLRFPSGEGQHGRFPVLRDDAAEWFGSPGGGEARGDWTVLGWEGIFEAVDEKFLESSKVGAIMETWAVKEMTQLGTFYAGVDLRGLIARSTPSWA
jgi:hypothetical protein